MKTPPLVSVAYRPFRTARFTYTHINILTIVLLVPAMVHGITLYGTLALRIFAGSLFFSLLWDIIFGWVAGKKNVQYDGNAAVTGLLLGMLLPPGTPWWIIAVGTAAALFLGKHVFGGSGASPFNAVCIGWVTVMISWPSIVDPTFGSVGLTLPFSTAFPLSEIHRGSDALTQFSSSLLLFGKQAGTVGTGASLLLIISGVIAIGVRIIPWQIPLSIFAGTGGAVLLFSLFSVEGTATPLFHMLTGFLCLGAFFIATDFSSRPVGKYSVWVYGFLIGALTVVFRIIGKYPEGFPFAVLIVNMFIPLFDRAKPPSLRSVPEVVRL